MSLPNLKNFFTRVDDTESDWYLTLSNHSLGTFNNCNRAGYYYILERRRENKGTAAQDQGAVFHLAQAIDARCSNKSQRDDLQIQAIEKFFIEHPVDETEYRNAERMVECIKRYNKTYKDRTIEVLLNAEHEPMVEIEFTLPLGRMVLNREVSIGRNEIIKIGILYLLWHGILDRLVKFDSEIFVMDFKTSSRSGPTYWEQFPMSQQQVGYTWAANQLYTGDIVKGTIIDTTTVRRPSPTGKPFDFDWQRFYYSKEQQDEWQENTVESIGTFISQLVVGKFPMTGTTQGCVLKYGKCPYLPICSMQPKFRNEVLFSDEYSDVVPRANGDPE
jgi:hypothetical protein